MTWVERIVEAWDNPNLNWDLRDAQLRENMRSLVSWLRNQRPWDLFWTQTYRGRCSENTAQSRWQSFLAEFNSSFPVTAAIWAVEPHKNTPRHHVHALLSMRSRKPSTLFRNNWRLWKEEAWRRLGKATIYPSQPEHVQYVMKYVMKTVSTGPAQSAATGYATNTPENLWMIWTNPQTGGNISA